MGEMADMDIIAHLSGYEREEEAKYDRESQWSRGIHVTKDYDEMRISDMDDNHLANTINLFKGRGYNTHHLETEQRLRKIQSTIN